MTQIIISMLQRIPPSLVSGDAGRESRFLRSTSLFSDRHTCAPGLASTHRLCFPPESIIQSEKPVLFLRKD